MKVLRCCFYANGETMPVLADRILPGQICEGAFKSNHAMGFTVNATEFVVSLAVNENFVLLNKAIAPVACSSRFNVGGLWIVPLSLRNDIKVSVKSISIAIHADKGKIQVLHFRAESECPPSRRIESNNV